MENIQFLSCEINYQVFLRSIFLLNSDIKNRLRDTCSALKFIYNFHLLHLILFKNFTTLLFVIDGGLNYLQDFTG